MRTMRIVVVGATGTIGKAVAEALAGRQHDVVRASRHGPVQVDQADPASLARLFREVKDVDAVVACAGGGAFKPLAQLTEADVAATVQDKLVGQVNVALAALRAIRDGGSVTLTSGILAQQPMPGGAAFSAVNGAVEAFARAAALEAGRGIRVNAVSPPWIQETLRALRMDPAMGIPAAACAKAYVAAIEGKHQGEILDARRFA